MNSTKLSRGRLSLAAAGLALAGLAMLNRAAARRAERAHPPTGSFLTVAGVRLHYTDRGEGQPVVLIHGNAVTGDDFNTSGLADLLLPRHRVIIFDRPGFGHSDRPRGRIWTANAQADLIHRALRQLGVDRPVVVGHSWGAILALALGVRHPADTAGLVLLSGYYFWTLRPDLLWVGAGCIPGIGDVLRYTLLPLQARLTMPLLHRGMFSPNPVPARFTAGYSVELAVRPWQIRATSADGLLMVPGVLSLRPHYREVRMPVVIMAGSGDRVVFARRARELHEKIRGSELHIIPDAGHMIHYVATRQVFEAIESVCTAARAGRPDASCVAAELAPQPQAA